MSQQRLVKYEGNLMNRSLVIDGETNFNELFFFLMLAENG